jgi:hypothetical protein
MLSRPQGHSAGGRIMSMKPSSCTIGNRIRDFPVCSAVVDAVPQPLRHRMLLYYHRAGQDRCEKSRPHWNSIPGPTYVVKQYISGNKNTHKMMSVHKRPTTVAHRKSNTKGRNLMYLSKHLSGRKFYIYPLLQKM